MRMPVLKSFLRHNPFICIRPQIVNITLEAIVMTTQNTNKLQMMVSQPVLHQRTRNSAVWQSG